MPLVSVNEVEFPAFTQALMEGVFETLLNVNMKQTDAYVKLLKETAKTVTQYVADTSPNVSHEQIAGYLASLPIDNTKSTNENYEIGSSGSGKTVPNNWASIFITDSANNSTPYLTKVAATEEENLYKVLGINSPIDSQKEGTINISEVSMLAAKKIATGNYEILKQMVQMGYNSLEFKDCMLRTSLNFHTYQNAGYSASHTGSDQNIKNSEGSISGGIRGGASKIGGALSGGFSSNKTVISVSTTSVSGYENSGAGAAIGGFVQIQFSSRYLTNNK